MLKERLNPLETKIDDPNILNKEGSTTLIRAITNGNLEIVTELMKHPKIDPYNVPPEYNKKNLKKTLMENIKEQNLTGEDGELIKYNNKIEIANLLIKKIEETETLTV